MYLRLATRAKASAITVKPVRRSPRPALRAIAQVHLCDSSRGGVLRYTAGMPEERGRVIGVGGVFLKSPDKQRLSAWYGEHLGIRQDTHGAMFPWLSRDAPTREHFTIWSVFPSDSTYFDPSTAPFMINYIVDDLDALLAKLSQSGVRIDPKREDYDYGRFAWIYDPDGNKIELWEPPLPATDPAAWTA